uniref:Bifunctional fucokinase/fucose-1-phosphate guanylyltransferase n=1 Tax=Prevotella sp. GTC17260 TaxID=3236796 RepID=A0AB33JDD7_9BACT
MKKLLSLPPNLVGCFHDVTGYSRDEWFCTNDPVGHKLGSGGGSTWLLQACHEAQNAGQSMHEWLGSERRLLLHAGGQSRRLPSYAPSGKILTPIPVFRWERGQRLSQDLLSLQIPLYERIMEAAPERFHTMIVSGDVYIRATKPLQEIPDADVVCYGLWLDSSIAKDHGVFVASRQSPGVMKCMLQKPSVETLNGLLKDHFYLTDIGIWLFSDRAIELLMKRSMKDGELINYDMYSDFGCCLGTNPTMVDEEIAQLKVAVLPLPGGEFYHFGTSHELLSSTLAVQNLESDQRKIMHHSRKPHPSMFVQNCLLRVKLTAENQNLWIENSCVGSRWTLSHEHIITGVPENDFELTLKAGQCVDVVPVGETLYVVRPYGFQDRFDGALQQKPMFPVVGSVEEVGLMLRYMLGLETGQDAQKLFEGCRKMSAEEISAEANLRRLFAQRRSFRNQNWPALARNHEHSVFYQVDLEDAAREYAAANLPEPDALTGQELLMTRIHDAMFRSELRRLKGEQGSEEQGEKAFSLLRQGLMEQVSAAGQRPHPTTYQDQIVWARSPVRIDIAGGWTDTPPYCLMEGGRVINLAIELNGQPPLQTYVKPCKERHIILRSIDLGASEEITTYEQLGDFNHVGSPFSIPKAALALAGFHPTYGEESFVSLEQQLDAFGSGIELTMLSAIPAGSGLGTSSILAATVLGALNDFCGLSWDKSEIGRRTLVLEQLLTTGGGWQDQFGGLLQGVKLLQTGRGFEQTPDVRYLPNDLFVQPEYKACHLLYYTGITRTAKTILGEIVRRMFLNQHDEIELLRRMKEHTKEMYEALLRQEFNTMGTLVRRTWQQNQLLDAGTNPAEVAQLTALIDDLCLGYKLPGAGGGGYLYMVAKDPEAAARIKKILNDRRLNANARFVDMSLSTTGLQVSRS